MSPKFVILIVIAIVIIGVWQFTTFGKDRTAEAFKPWYPETK